MAKVYVLGEVPASAAVHVSDVSEADAVVVGGDRERLFDYCELLPRTARPVIFVSDFSEREISDLAGLDIKALTPGDYARMYGSPERAPSLYERMVAGKSAEDAAGGRVIAVGSNKGGVGKTFASINLSAYIALAMPGMKVAAVEFDGEKEDFVMAAHLARPPELTVMKYLNSPGVLAACHPAIQNLHVIPYGSQEVLGLPGRMTEKKGRLILKGLRKAYDYVVVDMGIFSDLWCIDTALDEADTLLLIADEGRECLSRLVSFLTMRRVTVEKHLLINRITGSGYYSPLDVARALGFDEYYQVHEDHAVSRLARKGRLPVEARKTMAGREINSSFARMLGFSIQSPNIWSRIRILTKGWRWR